MKKLKSLVFCFVNLMFCLSILFFGLQRASAKELNIYSYRSPALLEPFTKQYEKEFNVLSLEASLCTFILVFFLILSFKLLEVECANCKSVLADDLFFSLKYSDLSVLFIEGNITQV